MERVDQTVAMVHAKHACTKCWGVGTYQGKGEIRYCHCCLRSIMRRLLDTMDFVSSHGMVDGSLTIVFDWIADLHIAAKNANLSPQEKMAWNYFLLTRKPASNTHHHYRAIEKTGEQVMHNRLYPPQRYFGKSWERLQSFPESWLPQAETDDTPCLDKCRAANIA